MLAILYKNEEAGFQPLPKVNKESVILYCKLQAMFASGQTLKDPKVSHYSSIILALAKDFNLLPTC